MKSFEGRKLSISEFKMLRNTLRTTKDNLSEVESYWAKGYLTEEEKKALVCVRSVLDRLLDSADKILALDCIH